MNHVTVCWRKPSNLIHQRVYVTQFSNFKQPQPDTNMAQLVKRVFHC